MLFRSNIPAGATVVADFNLGNKELEWWDENSNTVRVTPGKYEVFVGRSSMDKDLQKQELTIL